MLTDFTQWRISEDVMGQQSPTVQFSNKGDYYTADVVKRQHRLFLLFGDLSSISYHPLQLRGARPVALRCPFGGSVCLHDKGIVPSIKHMHVLMRACDYSYSQFQSYFSFGLPSAVIHPSCSLTKMSHSPIRIHFPRNEYISERNELKTVIVLTPSSFLRRKMIKFTTKPVYVLRKEELAQCFIGSFISCLYIFKPLFAYL